MEYSLEPIELSKELILSKYSEENIFEHYGVPIQKGLFCSKLRSDSHPTVSLYRNKHGRLICHDFGDGSSRDCFAYVQALFNVSYYMALQIIANDFGIIDRKTIKKNKAKLEYTDHKIETAEQAKINVEIRDWTKKDLDWWNKFGISLDTLKKFKVYPIKNAWLNDNIFYILNDNQSVYGYYGGIKDGIELWRLYYPGRSRFKFVSNWKSNQIQGAHMLSKSDNNFIVISKAMKDCMLLYEYGITAIAPCSENLFITDSQYSKLKQKFSKIFILYDRDLAGISNMNKVRKKYSDVIPLIIPAEAGYKDLTDIYKYRGKKYTSDLINKALLYYEEKEGKDSIQRINKESEIEILPWCEE